MNPNTERRAKIRRLHRALRGAQEAADLLRDQYDHSLAEHRRISSADFVEASRLAQEIYTGPQGGAGCCLHVVLDDGNIEDSSVEFCREWATNEGHPTCIACADVLARLSLTQRARVRDARYDEPATFVHETKPGPIEWHVRAPKVAR